MTLILAFGKSRTVPGDYDDGAAVTFNLLSANFNTPSYYSFNERNVPRI
jgi:hypothetical protein